LGGEDGVLVLEEWEWGWEVVGGEGGGEVRRWV